jgi:hypothetical protein
MTTLSEEYKWSRQSSNFYNLPLLKLSQNHNAVFYLQTPLIYVVSGKGIQNLKPI